MKDIPSSGIQARSQADKTPRDLGVIIESNLNMKEFCMTHSHNSFVTALNFAYIYNCLPCFHQFTSMPYLLCQCQVMKRFQRLKCIN